MAFTPSTLSSVEPSWQMMWHGLKSGGCKPQAPILPSVPRHEVGPLKVSPHALVNDCF